jgi:hypothetical protein
MKFTNIVFLLHRIVKTLIVVDWFIHEINWIWGKKLHEFVSGIIII